MVTRNVKWGDWACWFSSPGTFSYPCFKAKEWNASQFMISMLMSSSVYTQHLRESAEGAWIDWNAGDDHAALQHLIGNIRYINDYLVTLMHAAASNQYNIMEFELEPVDVMHAWLLYANYGPGGP